MPIGFDLGGTKLLMVADGPAGRVVERVPTGLAFDGRALSAAVESFLEAHGDAASAVGLAIPGLVGPGPFVQACDVLPGIVGWRPPASLTAGALRDDQRRRGRPRRGVPRRAGGVTAAVVMVGTGIGAALQLGGRPFGGANGWAGELGSIPIASGPDGVRTLDQLASGQALVTRLGTDGATVRARIEAGDEAALRAVQEAGTALGLGLAALIDLVNPALVSIGGGLSELPGYLEAALASAERHTLPDLWRACRVGRVRAGELVAALGAARVASS